MENIDRELLEAVEKIVKRIEELQKQSSLQQGDFIKELDGIISRLEKQIEKKDYSRLCLILVLVNTVLLLYLSFYLLVKHL